MPMNLICDGNFDFPNYPLGNGKLIVDMPTLQLESNKVSAGYVAPWVISDGYVTAYGLRYNEHFDVSWPIGSNAVLLGPLADNNARGMIHQKAVISTRTKLLLSFFSRVNIYDAKDKNSCVSGTLDVLVDNKTVGVFLCGARWQRKHLIISVPEQQSNVDIAFKDASPRPQTADCVSAIAAISLISYEPNSFEKVYGDEQFSYLNQMFKDLLTVRLSDRLGKPVGNAPITFDVTVGSAKLTTLRAKYSVVYSNSSTGEASVAVYGEGRGPVTVTVSAPGMRSLAFDLFVGPAQGQVDLIVSPLTIVVRKLGSDAAQIVAKSLFDDIPLPYFELTRGTLSNQLSFSQTADVQQRSPIGKTRSDGKILLPKVWRIGTTQNGGALTLEYDSGIKNIPIIFKH